VSADVELLAAGLLAAAAAFMTAMKKGGTSGSSSKRWPFRKGTYNESWDSPGSLYGPRTSPITGKPVFHGGIDIGAAEGTPVLAIADGTIIGVWPNHAQAGNYVHLSHDDGYSSRYLHLDSIDVLQGQRVRQGEQIGTAGNTGSSTSSHLHLEVWRHPDPYQVWSSPDQYRIDPLDYVRE
tara:strand:+ start:623 stop:1162 length:540 start_codon:yes stop_codon:yes gene_type:complete